METPQAIAQSLAIQPNSTRPASEDGLPPWLPDRVAAPRTKPTGRVEVVHWGVVALTLFTATSLLCGTYRGDSRPKELLPVVVMTGMP